MGSNFWWIYDLAAILIALICIVKCYRKGFSRIVITALGCAASLAIAYVVSKNTNGIVYDKFFKENNIKAVSLALNGYAPEDTIKSIIESNELSGVLSNDKVRDILKDGQDLDLLYEYANGKAANILDSKENFENNIITKFAENFAAQIGVNLPPYVVEEINEHIGMNKELFAETIDMLLNKPNEVPAFIEKNYIRDMGKKIISSIIFLVVFSVLMTIVFLVASKSVDFGLLNGFERLNKFAGALLGVVAAIAAIMLIAVAIKLIINMMDKENSFISLNTVEKTRIFKYFYKFL